LGVHFPKRSAAVKPVWALLSLASLIAIVVLLWRSPEARDRLSSVILGQPVAGASKPVAEAPEKPDKKAVKKPVNVRRSKPAPAPEAVQPVATETPKVKEPRIIETGPVVANVKSDSAAVYSFNSPRSPVVKVLTKGERVETNLEVIDSEGRWSLIHGDLTSGFVRSENLEKGQMAASRK
jgi:hypothetical protein